MSDLAPSNYQLMILKALQGKHIYYGTVDPGVRQKRRARNKVARQSRKHNR